MTGGVFGICAKENCLDLLYQGTFRLQGRGQEYCGLCSYDGNEQKIRTHRGLVIPTFENDLEGMDGYTGIGSTSSLERQPVERNASFGKFFLTFDGYITNAHALRKELFGQGYSFGTDSQAELLSKIIAQGTDIIDGIKKCLEKIQGRASLVILFEDSIFAAKDVKGFQPLAIGRLDDSWVVASESCAFGTNTGKEIFRDVEPGEIVQISDKGIQQIRKITTSQIKICVFEWIYFARFDSVILNMPVARAGHNLGGFLAKADDVEADVVGAVPFSGIRHAEGYHLESKLPKCEVFMLPQYRKRTYIMPIAAPPEEEEEFIAATHSVEEIREFIHADTLMYQEFDKVAEAIGQPLDHLCMDCFIKE